MDSSPTVYSKISWEVDNTKRWQDIFYPSEVERISRSHDYYAENFAISFTELDQQTYLEEFLPIYTREISSRSNYTLNLTEQKNLVLKRISERSPILMIGKAIERSTNSLAGGLLFSLWEDRISVMHRVFDRAINKQYKKHTTIDFWFETQFREYSHGLTQPILTHGHDTHPYIQRVGLPEYKLRIGSRPKTSRIDYGLKTVDIDTIMQTNTLVLYFENPEHREFQKATLLYTADSNESVRNSCKTILDWANIPTEFKLYQ